MIHRDPTRLVNEIKNTPPPPSIDVIRIHDGHFSDQLRMARLRKRMTQRDLADKAGVSQQSISIIESGKMEPSLRILVAIASALNETIVINPLRERR